MARTDEELLTATPRDPQAFGELYARYERPVLRFMLSRTRDAELAADLAAETFAAALLSARRYRGDGPAGAWLWGVARRVLAGSLRRRRVEDAARRRLRMPRLVLDDATLDAIRGLEAELTAEALLAELPSQQADAIRLHVLEDLGYPEVASSLGCSEQVVRQRVSRGLRALRTSSEETT
jgi:RNA polymerase sigma-70 factor (ECF subfamily)